MSPQLSPPTDAESRGPALLLESDLRLLSQVVQASADGIFCQDTDGIVISWNAGAERIYGYSAAEMIGRRADELEPPSTRERLMAAHAAVSAGQRMEHFDSWHRRSDGEIFPVSVTASPLRDSAGAVVAVATSVADISRRVELALELDLARAEVEQHNVALRRSNRELEQFAYVASHDLSEPLRVMTGYVDRLEGRYDAVLDDRGRRYMQHIVDASARMRALIDDLLKYSQFLKADNEGSMIDTAAVLTEVCASLGPTLLETGATVDIAELPPVWSDVFHLTSLLQNLLSNALKFRRPEQPPHVAFSCDVEDGWVTLHVDDNGIGIEPEYRDRVFRMFQRLHVRELYGGTGIGLAIAQKIVELNGGRIWIDNSPLGGARFSVTLPSVAPAKAASDV
jgi:PAS domain S-box-containing protein